MAEWPSNEQFSSVENVNSSMQTKDTQPELSMDSITSSELQKKINRKVVKIMEAMNGYSVMKGNGELAVFSGKNALEDMLDHLRTFYLELAMKGE